LIFILIYFELRDTENQQLVPLKAENILSHTHETESWDFSGILFKMSDEHARPFYVEAPGGKRRIVLELLVLI